MKIYISKSKTQAYFFDIELKINNLNRACQLQLPAWRPGRYELQNYAKNIPKIEAFDEKNRKLQIEKLSKDLWQVLSNKGEITVKYSYYANKKDAGNSFVDHSTFYLNFVNCIPYLVGKMQEPLEVFLLIPNKYKIASGLIFNKISVYWHCKLNNIYELYDSPTIASEALITQNYRVANIDFFIHFVGNYSPNWPRIIADFKAFSEFQIFKMGDFPRNNFHFINWILPSPYYHGVEHGNSTMLVLGPDTEGDNLMPDLLGVASHELFHSWNICKIRPVELLPYDFTKENYFNTGFIVEGVTTYLGDLILLHSNVISFEEYLKELNAILMRHFLKDGKARQSLTEASVDLWVDGYTEGIPNKKVSIYNKGAIVALILDLKIRNKFSHTKSIYYVMKQMWELFGKTNIGYQLLDYKLIAENIFEENLDNYFETCIFGNTDLLPILNLELSKIGLEINYNYDVSISISEKTDLTLTQKNNLLKFKTDNNFAAI